MQSSSDTPTEAWYILGIIGLIIFVYLIEYMRIIIKVMIILSISAISLFILYKIIKNIIKKREEYKSDKNHFLNKLKEIKKDYYSSSDKVKENIQKLNEVISEDHKFYLELKKEINNIKKTLNSKYKKLKREEQEEIKKLKEERQEELRKKELEEIREKQAVSKLLKYFKKRKSSKSIPKWALKYDDNITNKAEREYKHIEWKINYKKEKWDEVKEFVQKHKAYPLDFNEKNKEIQDMYRKALKLLKKGELRPEPKVRKEDKEFYNRDFIYAKELDAEQRERFLKEYGYRHRPFIHLDGRSGNNLIIRNDKRKENDYHFCVKNMFYRMDKRAKLEYSVEGLRADVVFILDNKKIAVEVETGSNKEIQFSKKIKWLDRNFDYWIFVCSRKNYSKYKKYVDNKKSFCLFLKEASEKIKELIR